MTNNPYAIHEPPKDNPGEIEIPPNGTSLDLLQQVYKRSDLPLSTRMRAAGLALPHEHPKLAVTGLVTEGDFAQILDKRIAHYQQLQRANNTKLIEASAEPEPDKLIEADEVKPTPTMNYRAYNGRFNRRF
jgi:hypothetical protein